MNRSAEDELELPPRPRFRVITAKQLGELPDPSWLVEGLLPAGGLGLLFGPPGIGKTFLALDLAMCVATGTRWMSRTVRGGPVVYLALESLSGFKLRVQAWRTHWEKEDSQDRHLRFIGEAPNLLDLEDVGELARAIRGSDPLLPTLVVVDTLARAAGGADENAARDMGQVVAALDHLRALLRSSGGECAVLVIHHTPKANPRTPRGSSALLGAVDVALALDGEPESLTLTVEKLRDGQAPPPIRLRLERTDLAAVVVPTSGDTEEGEVPASAMRTLQALGDTAVPDGLLAAEWEGASEQSRRTFFRHRKLLLDKGLVKVQRNRYHLTPAGSAKCQKSVT